MGTSPAPGGRRVWVLVILGVLMLAALGLRLHTVWQRLSQIPDGPVVQLVGDEVGYEALADSLLHGSFFHSPVRGPVYPLFIAAVYTMLGERSPAKLLYVQAFVGVTVVPLTYLLARGVTGRIPALVAAGLMNKQIAFQLGLAEVTVKLHRGGLMRKMGARSVAELARMAEVLGIPSPKPRPSYTAG